MDFRVYLRALEPEDYKTTIEWRQEDEVWDNFIGPRRYVSSDTEKRWVEKSIIEHEKGERLRFGVCLKETNELIGLITFSNIDLLNRNCLWSAIIGKEHRNKGFIYDATYVSFDYMFRQYGMKRIEGNVLETNKNSINYLERIGCVNEGILRSATYKKGTFVNLLVYSMLDTDFYNIHGKYFI